MEKLSKSEIEKKLVVIESPFAGDVEMNKCYARAAMSDCLDRKEQPYASHLLFTQPGILDDNDPKERRLGIQAGFLWGQNAEVTVVYTDLGITKGMKQGIEAAKERGAEVEYRTLEAWQ
ncbi:hypothetical protein ACFL0Y_02560 [Patescibacteria group bacterium]